MTPYTSASTDAELSAICNSFLAGDPLHAITEDANTHSWDALNALSTRIADRGEEQRSKSLRTRCSETVQILRRDDERIWQLVEAGVPGSDIPKVLVAFGSTVDVDIAADLLKSPELFLRISRGQEAEPPLPTDTLSLLYITGCHRGIKPDYPFALRKIPMPGVTAFRELHVGQLLQGQVAEIIAIAETTAGAIRTGDTAGISYEDYARIVAASQEPDNHGPEWLVPAPVLRRRLGGGFWSSALERAGLSIPSTRARFTSADYDEAARSFRKAYHDFGSPKDVASYDSWVTAEAAAGRDHPSVIEIRRFFGAWESVIGAVMPPEVGVEEFAGLVAMCRTQSDEEYDWARAGERVSDVLANMPWNSFLSIDYGDESDGPRRPYAQANPSADGVWCEIVSEEFLPADEWPIETDYLLRNGWCAPDEEVPNWHKQGVPPLEAGHQLLEGLARGRFCHDPQKVRWHSGDFPGGPGPEGGVILDFEPGGIVRNLRRAS